MSKKLWDLIYENPRRKIKRFVKDFSYIYLPKNKINGEYFIIDNFEPSILLNGFRVKEFNWLLNSHNDFKLLTFSSLMYNKLWKSNLKNIDWSTPREYNSYKNLKQDYSKYFNISEDKFLIIQNRKYSAKGAYIMFLYNTFLSIDFLEKNNIPFVFILFPGGGFKLDNEFSDFMMETVFSSKMFRGCFVPQQIIYDYIIKKGFTSEDKLFFSYGGGFFQFTKEDVLEKKWFKKDKDTFDISFVGYRYMKKGLDKGFDLAIKSLQQLIKNYPFVHLHCVGTNTLSDFDEDFSDIKDNIHFYGIQKAEFFPTFFQNIDLALSPNRVNVLDKGAFDGFPLQSESGFFGVPIFCSDELGINKNYEDKKDLVIIIPDIDDIIQNIEYFIKNMEELKKIGEQGQLKIQKYFDINHQISEREKFLNKFLLNSNAI